MKRLNMTIGILMVIAFMVLFSTANSVAKMEEPQKVKFADRVGWKLQNDLIEVVVLEGGGHIVCAKFVKKDMPQTNPFWIPHWKSIEPKDFDKKKHAPIYGDDHEGKLLASLMGHNICLDFFGVPSPEEYKHGGITVHGEGPVVMWKVSKKWANDTEVGIVYGADLPKSQLHIERTVTLKKGEPVFYVTEKLTNKGYFDRPFSWCQHVTMGAPFVKGGETVFDIPAYRSSVAPFKFSEKMRYKEGAEFRWPYCPGSKKDMVVTRVAATETESSDYTTQLLDPNLPYGYFTAANPELNLMMGYVWNRKDFPWLDNWEENHARTHKPWKGKETTRGMEFSNNPLTYTRQKCVELGKFFDTPTYRWIKAGETITTHYVGFLSKITKDFKGTQMLEICPKGITIERTDGKKWDIPCSGVENIVK